MENCCPLCGDFTIPSDNDLNETNTTLFVTSTEFQTVFQCFLKLFEITDPPWFEKAFVFCSECTRMLTVVSELELVLKEVEKKLKAREKMVKEKLKSSEIKFLSNGLYQKHQRYWKVRGPFLTGSGSGGTPTVRKATVIDSSVPPVIDASIVKEEETEQNLEEGEDEGEILKDDDEEKSKARKTSLSSTSLDPASFAQKLEGGLVEHIKVEVDPPPYCEDDQESFEAGEKEGNSLSESQSSLDSDSASVTSTEDDDSSTSMTTTFLKGGTPQKQERATALPRKGRRKRPKFFELPKKFGCNQGSKQFPTDSELHQHSNHPHHPSSTTRTTTQKVVLVVDDSSFTHHDVILYKVPGDDDQEKYKCSKCDTILNSMKKARAHVVLKHTSPFQCDRCERSFPQKCLLERHLRMSHKVGAPTYCHICGCPFYGNGPTRCHLWTHFSDEDKQEALARGEAVPFGAEKRFQCELCTSSYPYKFELVKHQRRAHEKIARQKKLCVVCGDSVVDLANHMRGKHAKESDYRYLCTACDKRFVFSSQLKKHKVAHSQEKPFKCDFCDKEFVLESYLKLHRMGHLNIKPFQCPHCPMSFTRKKVMERHVEGVHEGKKFYQQPRRKRPKF